MSPHLLLDAAGAVYQRGWTLLGMALYAYVCWFLLAFASDYTRAARATWAVNSRGVRVVTAAFAALLWLAASAYTAYVAVGTVIVFLCKGELSCF
jgi:hypothetical protein